MKTKWKTSNTATCEKLVVSFMAIMMLLGVSPMGVLAASGKTEVAGMIYEFDKNSHYELEAYGSSEETGSNNTYGTFYISGNVSDVNEELGVPAYEVNDGNLEFYYNYGDTMLNAGEDEWHLVDDKDKNVADTSLPQDIKKGAIVIQTSKDRKNWTNADTICNAFREMLLAIRN